MASKRRFELAEGVSNKFWEVWIDGRSVGVRYGKLGTEGQSKLKPFDSDNAAEKELAKLVKEKVTKGYREVVTDPMAPAKEATRQAPWKPRFEKMVAELRRNKKIQGLQASFGAPATSAQIDAARAAFGAPLDDDLASFYAEMNGLKVTWHALEGDVDGDIDFLPLERVFGAGAPAAAGGLLPFELCDGARFCAAFRAGETPQRVYALPCNDASVALCPTGLPFAEFIERVLASRGTFDWLLSITEAHADGREAEDFREFAGMLFKGVDWRLFRPAAEAELGALATAAIVERLRNGAPVSRAMAEELQLRPDGLDALRPLLVASDAGTRLQALRILAKTTTDTIDLLELVLRAEVGVESSADSPLDKASYDALNNLRAHTKSKGFQQRLERALQQENHVQPFRLAFQMSNIFAFNADALDKTRIYSLALEAIRGGTAEERESASTILYNIGRGADAFAVLLADAPEAAGEALVRRLDQIASTGCDEAMAFLESHLTHADPAIRVAALRVVGSPDHHAQALGDSSERVKSAAVQFFAEALRECVRLESRCSRSVLRAYQQDTKRMADVLRGVADDDRQPASIRKQATDALHVHVPTQTASP